MIYPQATLLGTEAIGHMWKHLGTWEDGSLLVTCDPVVRLRWTGDRWEHQTLGRSFSDFMARLTAAEGNAYWEDLDYVAPVVIPRWMEFEPPTARDPSLGEPLQMLMRQNRRLRSMKLADQDVFRIYPASGNYPSHLPAPLRTLYQNCDGVVQQGGFEIWPLSRVEALPDTQRRWFEVGAAPGYRILFDGVAQRGVVVLATEEQRIYRIAQSFADFFKNAERAPQVLYWEESKGINEFELARPSLLWPDEKLPAV